ncbi:MAG: peptidoglycan DD-metalloendopeptidase family protein [Lachnospiraceae bacterium]|nr:peptidoglycan DD-metalloendopeptidase family protein [Lachnospiraceae bacterium]
MNYYDIGNGSNNNRHRKNRVRNNIRSKRKGLRKEQIIMLTASLFVLSALTMTGVYVKEKNKADNDEYVVDLSSIEKNIPDKVEEIAENQIEQDDQASINDMDVDPAYEEANSGSVRNSVLDTQDTIQIPGVGTVKESSHSVEQAIEEELNREQNLESSPVVEDEVEAAASEKAVAKKSYQFSEKDQLQWPIVGNVLINYSMDKTIYFPTLDQYKYNPAIVIQADKGKAVTAAASGEVTKVFQDAEIGNAVVVDIGNGYEVTYGQLEDVQVSTGQNIETGELLGKVADPTKYYSVEGSNVYFKVTHDEVPVNPMGQLD